VVVVVVVIEETDNVVMANTSSIDGLPIAKLGMLWSNAIYAMFVRQK
jgi:hypothetical protein